MNRFICAKKFIAADDMEDRCCHKVFKDEKYFEGFYLEKVRIKESRVIYKLLEKHVIFLHIDEIHQMFVDLSMPKEEYLAIINSF